MSENLSSYSTFIMRLDDSELGTKNSASKVTFIIYFSPPARVQQATLLPGWFEQWSAFFRLTISEIGPRAAKYTISAIGCSEATARPIPGPGVAIVGAWRRPDWGAKTGV